MEWIIICFVIVVLLGLSRQGRPIEKTKLKDVPKAFSEGLGLLERGATQLELTSVSLLVKATQKANHRNIKNNKLPLDTLEEFIDRTDLPIQDRAYLLGVQLLSQETSLIPSMLEKKHESLLTYVSGAAVQNIKTDAELNAALKKVLVLIPTDEEYETAIARVHQCTRQESLAVTEAKRKPEVIAKLDTQPIKEKNLSSVSSKIVKPLELVVEPPSKQNISSTAQDVVTKVPVLIVPNTHLASNTIEFKTIYLSSVEQFKREIIDWKSAYGSFRNQSDKAKKPLNSQLDLLVYMVAYGYTHHLAFLKTLDYTSHKFFKLQGDIITVVDYGCGQGIATLAFLDYIAQQPSINIKHIDIILIEPSKIAINKACQYINDFIKIRKIKADIISHICGFDDLPSNFLDLQHTQEYIHLFSNVLDVLNWGYFNPSKLTQKIKRKHAKHHLIASSPMTQNVVNTKQSLNSFLDVLRPVVYAEGEEHKITGGLFYNMQAQSIQESERNIYRIYATWGNYD